MAVKILRNWLLRLLNIWKQHQIVWTLSQCIKTISYFKIGESNWKSSVQVRLSSDKSFTKTGDAKPSYWTLSKAKCYFCDFESKDGELYKQHIQSCIEQSTKSQISIKKRTNSEEINLMPSKRNKVDAESISQISETFDSNEYDFNAGEDLGTKTSFGR